MNEELFSQENPVPTRDGSDGIMYWYIFRRLVGGRTQDGLDELWWVGRSSR